MTTFLKIIVYKRKEVAWYNNERLGLVLQTINNINSIFSFFFTRDFWYVSFDNLHNDMPNVRNNSFSVLANEREP